jgi:hypothetical protein
MELAIIDLYENRWAEGMKAAARSLARLVRRMIRKAAA